MIRRLDSDHVVISVAAAALSLIAASFLAPVLLSSPAFAESITFSALARLVP